MAKARKVWNWLVLACVCLVLCLAINAAPVLVMGPAKAIVWVARVVSSLLLPSKASAQDSAVVTLPELVVSRPQSRVVLYSCHELGATGSVVCSLLAPFLWQDTAAMALSSEGVLIGYALDACGARQVTLDFRRGLYSSVGIGSGSCGPDELVTAIDLASQW